MDSITLVRHELAALAYRFVKAVRGAPEGFGEFDAGAGVRPPRALVHHINGVLGYLAQALEHGDERGRFHHPELDWEGEVAAFHASLERLDAIVRRTTPRLETLQRALQGPLADAMTHVGQLALLRRLAGAPVHAENFYFADVRVGRLGPEQAAPVSPDP